MTRLAVFLAAFAISLWLSVVPGSTAQGGGGGGPSGLGKGHGMPSIQDRERSRPAGRPSDIKKPSETGFGKETSGTGGKKTVADLLMQNTKLSSKLQGLLPAGTNLQEASKGFEHLGQFVSAVHVSHNLGIPFDQLKAKLMAGKSLGQAIHELKPGVDARKEAIRANEHALEDMEKSLARKR